MKKTLITKTLLPVFALAILFSSCLGNSSSTKEGTEYVYITEVTASNEMPVKIAFVLTYGFLITNKTLRESADIRMGEFYMMHYRLNYDKFYDSRNLIYEVEQIREQGKLERIDLRYQQIPENMENTVIPKKISTTTSDPYSFIDDNWILEFSVEAKLPSGKKASDVEDKFDFQFYFDETMQHQGIDKTKIEPFQGIIDLFVIDNRDADEIDESATPTTITWKRAISFSTVRAILELGLKENTTPTKPIEDAEGKKLPFLIRYDIPKTNDNDLGKDYLGSLNNISNGYYFNYIEDKVN